MNSLTTMKNTSFVPTKSIQEISKKVNSPSNKIQNSLLNYAKLTRQSTEQLIGKDRHAEIMLTRKAIWLKMRKEGYTLKEIADVFNRTHPTIISGIYNIEGLLEIKDQQSIHILKTLNTMDKKL